MISGELWPFAIIVLVGFLPNEIWRMAGLFASHGLRDDSEWIVLAKVVATAIVAGAVLKLLVSPSGAMGEIPVAIRAAGCAAGYLTYVFGGRSIFIGMAAGELVFLLGGYLFRSGLAG